jgi:hypothetical protein
MRTHIRSHVRRANEFCLSRTRPPTPVRGEQPKDRLADGGERLRRETAARSRDRRRGARRVKLLRFVEPQRSVGLAWRPTSTRMAGLLELGQNMLKTERRKHAPLSRDPLTLGSFRTAKSLS